MWRILINVVLAAQAVTAQFPFMNISLSWADRVDDLVGRLTLPDVMFQMAKGGAGPQGGPAPAIPRLGIEPWAWNTECLRGDANSGLATGFPQALGLAAAFK
ncbi:xylan 1,4-beta-xylosidase-like [Dreissena polymorpha]|uniref:xylan 1,4-beta-xylosidase-like n=1 Tax=Dreissena polymorpha TaxID=45954 RepID=UPI002265673A|nr:xylan 1,4-beta-xylosidase-like [Dreissena polymorpha]